MGVCHQGHLELGGGGHFLGDELHHGFGLLLRAFHDQFVVNLEHQPGGQIFLLHPVPNPDHRQLDDIRGGALDGGVQRHALGPGTDIEIGAFQLRQTAAAAIAGFHIALFPGVLHHVFHIGLHAGVVAQIAVDIRPGFLPGDADVPGQREIGDAIDNAEVHGLGTAAHLGGDFLGGDAEYCSCGNGVEILAGTECILHGLVIGNIAEYPQLDLAVVRVHQYTARGGDEHLANFAAQFRANGDVLEVGIGGAQPAGGSDHVLKGGVNSSVGTDDL